jgi:hypothetical protein
MSLTLLLDGSHFFGMEKSHFGVAVVAAAMGING